MTTRGGSGTRRPRETRRGGEVPAPRRAGRAPAATRAAEVAREHRAFGVVTLALGLLALLSTGWLSLLSTTDVLAPDDRLRVPGLVGLAVGSAGALVVGLGTVLRPGPGHRPAVAGLTAAALAVVALAVLLLVAH